MCVSSVLWKHCFPKGRPCRWIYPLPPSLQWRGLASSWDFPLSSCPSDSRGFFLLLLIPSETMSFLAQILFKLSDRASCFPGLSASYCFCSWFPRSPDESCQWNHVSARKLDWPAISLTSLVSLITLKLSLLQSLGKSPCSPGKPHRQEQSFPSTFYLAFWSCKLPPGSPTQLCIWYFMISLAQISNFSKFFLQISFRGLRGMWWYL